MTAQVKICGIRDAETLRKTVQSGADFIGFVFYPPSPRFVTSEEAAILAAEVPDHVKKVGLFVDARDEALAHTLKTVKLDMIQLHGGETPEHILTLKKTYGLPVMKALSISSKEDLAQAELFEHVCDWLLFDAKSTTLPGGNGIAFDWSLLKDYQGTKPWMLAGGLTPENVGDALSLLSPDAVDVSSGVEKEKGQKDIGKIIAFINTVKHA